LRKQGIRNALVNIGGNVLALGQHGKRPWRVGIQHPRKPGALATLELRDGEAIGTSGDYQRYFMLGEKTLLPPDRSAQRPPRRGCAGGDRADARSARRGAVRRGFQAAVHRRNRRLARRRSADEPDRCDAGG